MKVGILTIIGDNNYGNRLQNYATVESLKKIGVDKVITIRNHQILNKKEKNFLKYILRIVKYSFIKVFNKTIDKERLENFKKFDEYIFFSKKIYTPYTKELDKELDFCLVGSDQVWNPYLGRMRDMDLLSFLPTNKRIAFSASFACSNIPIDNENMLQKYLKGYKAISVREEAGKEIIKKATGMENVEVLIDPTMLLTAEEWDKVLKRPYQLDMLNGKKYILNYFLGNLSENRKKEIERIAKENDCEVINILDKNSPFYQTGPSEFLYLEKNAFLICTDSFHSCVFAILYNRPFIVFKRDENIISMNSRIETLINKFNLKNREYNGEKITEENLNHDYTEAYEILEKEREKASNFLKRALDIKE